MRATFRPLRSYFAQLARWYPDPLDYYRARALMIISSGIAILAGLLAIETWISILLGLAEDLPSDLPFRFLAAAVIFSVPPVLVHTRRLLGARLAFVGLLIVLSGATVFFTGAFSYAAAVMVLTTLAASVFFGNVGTVLGGLLSAAIVTGLGLAEANGLFTSYYVENPDALLTPVNLAMTDTIIFASGLMLWLVTGSFQRMMVQSQAAAQQLRAIAEIGEAANAMLGQEGLLMRLVEMIRERLDFYHVQIFHVDEAGQDAVLVASTGEPGRQLLARGHRLPVGSRSVIGQATRLGEQIYALDTSSNPVHRANEFLPATRSELALPLFDGTRVVGAVDVQSEQPNAFSPQDIETLQVMANLISTTIRNQQTLRQLQGSLDENERLIAQTQDTLREVERLNRQLTGAAWEDYISTSEQDLGLRLESGGIYRDLAWSQPLMQAIQAAAPVTLDAGTEHVVAVPLEVRGNILGALEVALPPGVSPDDARELAQAVADRLALTLDNARLFEEAQLLAQQEHIVNEISGQLQSVTRVDDMLRVALSELSRALGAEQAAVRLHVADTARPGTGPLAEPAAAGNGQEG
ncbi:MAG: GAF domain-containing protein [Anaerolineae bacterium]|nr:GAF domain-containing protein [Anaerolineae bacterium]